MKITKISKIISIIILLSLVSFFAYIVHGKPTISSVILNPANSLLIVTFSEDVYDTTGGAGDLEVTDFNLSISGGKATLDSETPRSIAKVSQSVWAILFDTSGTANGAETITIAPASNSSIYNSSSKAAATRQSNNMIKFNFK